MQRPYIVLVRERCNDNEQLLIYVQFEVVTPSALFHRTHPWHIRCLPPLLVSWEWKSGLGASPRVSPHSACVDRSNHDTSSIPSAVSSEPLVWPEYNRYKIVIKPRYAKIDINSKRMKLRCSKCAPAVLVSMQNCYSADKRNYKAGLLKRKQALLASLCRHVGGKNKKDVRELNIFGLCNRWKTQREKQQKSDVWDK